MSVNISRFDESNFKSNGLFFCTIIDGGAVRAERVLSIATGIISCFVVYYNNIIFDIGW